MDLSHHQAHHQSESRTGGLILMINICWPARHVDLNLAPAVLSLNQIPAQLSGNIFTHEMTGNSGGLRENRSEGWRQKTITTSLGNFLSPAASRQDCLEISHKLHIKTNDQHWEGGRLGGREQRPRPTLPSRGICLSDWATSSGEPRLRTDKSGPVRLPH